MADLTSEGLVADLFGGVTAGKVDEALAAYTMERLDEVLSVTPVPDEGILVEVGLRPTKGMLRAEVYAVRRPGLLHG